MGAESSRPIQLAFGNDPTAIKTRGEIGVSVYNQFKITGFPEINQIVTASERPVHMDADIKNEILRLWMVGKGNKIRVLSRKNNFTEVFLKKDAILYRKPQKNSRKKFLIILSFLYL